MKALIFIYGLLFVMTRVVAAVDLSCSEPFDLVFVLDGSDSLKSEEFLAMKSFVLNVIRSLKLGANDVQIGALVYSTFIGGSVDLGQFNNYEVLKIFISKLQQPRQGTATDLAIKSMKAMFDGRAESRKNFRKIGVIVTDGRSTSPQTTINEAELAKNSGIEIVAIGYGTDVFVYELERIASYPDRSLILTNNMTGAAFLQEFEEKIRSLICVATLPTYTTPLPTMPSIPLNSYKPFPGDCTKYYYVKNYINGQTIQEVLTCPFGMFWDSLLEKCHYTWLAHCVYDPCSAYSSGTLTMQELCSGYWTCFNFRSNATCCPKPNQRYVQGLGCVDDFSCQMPCVNEFDNSQEPSSRCTRYPYYSNPARYFEENHGRNITRHCAPGTEFDPSTCSCSLYSHQISNYVPVNDQDFEKPNYNHQEYIKNGLPPVEVHGSNSIADNNGDSSNGFNKIEITEKLPRIRVFPKTSRDNFDMFDNQINLFNGNDFFNTWQANQIPSNDVFMDDPPGDSFQLWSPSTAFVNNRRRIRVFPKTSRDNVMSWQRSNSIFS